MDHDSPPTPQIAADDILFDAWCDGQSHASHQQHYLRLLAELAAARERCDGLAERVAQQSELLTRRAEKP